MFLTVIIPHYNNVALLGRCLQSLSAAGLGDGLQVVVVDDGSSPGQHEQFDALIRQTDSLSIQPVYNTVNRGASAARNRGLLSAKGRFVWFVDADDEVDSGVLRQWWPRLEAVDERVELIHLGPMVRWNSGQAGASLRPGETHNDHGQVENATLADIITPRSHCLDHTTYWISRKFLSRNPDIRYLETVSILEDSVFVLRLLDQTRHVAMAHDCRLYIRHDEAHSVTSGAWSKEKSAGFVPDILFFFTQLSDFMDRHEELTHVVDLYHRYAYVYMRVLAVKGVPDSLYRSMFYNPVVRYGFIPRNMKERLLKNTMIHAFISFACRVLRPSHE